MTAEDVPEFINALRINERYMKKIAHTFDGEGFKGTPSTKRGELKEKEKVTKVSKVFQSKL